MCSTVRQLTSALSHAACRHFTGRQHTSPHYFKMSSYTSMLGVIVLLYLAAGGGCVRGELDFNDRSLTRGYGYMICSLAKCPYDPENPLQLQACGTSARLKQGNTTTKDLFTCQDITTKEECTDSVATQDKKGCIWVPIPIEFQDTQGLGGCQPMSVGHPLLESQYGVTMFLQGMKKYNVTVPTTPEQNDCLKHSYNETACKAAFDRRINSEYPKGRPCGWCTGLNGKYFPLSPPTNSLCIQQYAIDAGACRLLLKENEPCTRAPTPSTTTTLSPSTTAPTTARSTSEAAASFCLFCLSTLLATALLFWIGRNGVAGWVPSLEL